MNVKKNSNLKWIFEDLNLETKNSLTATSQMLIRRPVGEVFEALVNPDITSKFWFTRGSDRLEPGKTVQWEWGQFGVEAEIKVDEIKQDQQILFRWPADEEGLAYRTVEITFEPKSSDSTFVRVTEKGFERDDEQLIENIAGQTEGWALVLSAMKAWLEQGINLNLIGDHHPG